MERNVADAGLQLSGSGKVAQTMGNCVKALLYDEATRKMFKYNELSNMIEVSGAWWNRGKSPNMTDSDINFIRLYLETFYGLASERGVPRAIESIAIQNSYHPIKEYLNSLKWDGQKYIETLFPRFLGCDQCEYTTEATRLFMLGAISRVFHPGVKFETVVCLVEQKQGGGKSTMVRYMAVDDSWFTDSLNRLDNENVYRYIQGHWIIEFSEMLATANTKTVEDIKSFISRQKDTYKVPYDRFPKDYDRQCVFMGTTNNIDFLPRDRTGNRRFVPLKVNSSAAQLHPVEYEKEAREHVEKAWAEAMYIFKNNNYSLTFPKHLQKELKELLEEHEPEDSKVGIIQEWLDNCEYDYVCSTMVCKEALGIDNPKGWEQRDVCQIMESGKIEGWIKHPTSDSKRRFKDYGKQRAWDRVTVKCPLNGFQRIEEISLEQAGLEFEP